MRLILPLIFFGIFKKGLTAVKGFDFCKGIRLLQKDACGVDGSEPNTGCGLYKNMGVGSVRAGVALWMGLWSC